MTFKHELREKILIILNTNYRFEPVSQFVNIADKADSLMALITEQDKQYRELVEAAVGLITNWDKTGLTEGHGDKLRDAIKPFLPPKPSLSENLEALRPRICQDDSIVDNKLKEYIAEAKQLEAKVNE